MKLPLGPRTRIKNQLKELKLVFRSPGPRSVGRIEADHSKWSSGFLDRFLIGQQIPGDGSAKATTKQHGQHCIVSLGTHAIAPSMFEHF